MNKKPEDEEVLSLLNLYQRTRLTEIMGMSIDRVALFHQGGLKNDNYMIFAASCSFTYLFLRLVGHKYTVIMYLLSAALGLIFTCLRHVISYCYRGNDLNGRN